MTAETDLLPLPESNGSYTNPYDGDDLENYARANLAEAASQIEKLTQEVEGLREYKRLADEANENLRTFVKVEEARTAAAEALAERLGEALHALLNAPPPCSCAIQGCGTTWCSENVRLNAKFSAQALLDELN